MPKETSSHLVYNFKCSCFNTTYYGESKRHFFIRAFEHLGTAPLTGKQVKNINKSSIIDHILLKGHGASFGDFKILLKKSNKPKLNLKESLLIKRGKSEFNGDIYSCAEPSD